MSATPGAPRSGGHESSGGVVPPPPAAPVDGEAAVLTPASLDAQRLRKFEALLAADVVDLRALRAAAWSGVPRACRPVCWQLLLGYLPSRREGRAATLQRKRREYMEAVPQYFNVPDEERTEHQRGILHQILMDVPRTAPAAKIFHHAVVQRALERVLYVWALRHPASGYVQGINDLVTPFFFAFLVQSLPTGRPATVEVHPASLPSRYGPVGAQPTNPGWSVLALVTVWRLWSSRLWRPRVSHATSSPPACSSLRLLPRSRACMPLPVCVGHRSFLFLAGHRHCFLPYYHYRS